MSGIVLSPSGKCSFGEWVNIVQICCDNSVQHLNFPESSKKVTSDVFRDSWKLIFSDVVQGLRLWLEETFCINAVGLYTLGNGWATSLPNTRLTGNIMQSFLF